MNTPEDDRTIPSPDAAGAPKEEPPRPEQLPEAAEKASDMESAVQPAIAANAPPETADSASVGLVSGYDEDDAVRAHYEHPWAIRFSHWLNAVAIFVLITSGMRIYDAFPTFGPRVPEKPFLKIPKLLTLGGWLGGALRWHFTFMWVFVGTGLFYLAYQFISGHYRTVLFTPRDVPGVWPMVRHYFLFGPKPRVEEPYNPLQKLAYTVTVGLGIISVLTGVVLYKPIQFSWLAWLMGGYHLARVWHFAALVGFLAFIPGHLIMVLLHGWDNFLAMLTGWKRNPEYGVPPALHGAHLPRRVASTAGVEGSGAAGARS